MKAVVLLAAAMAASTLAGAQRTNRYLRLAGYGHQIYLEGYELPLLTTGLIDPAESRGGKRLVFASCGWIWLFDPGTGVATRLTKRASVDAPPAWSTDGRSIAFAPTSAHSMWQIRLRDRIHKCGSPQAAGPLRGGTPTVGRSIARAIAPKLHSSRSRRRDKPRDAARTAPRLLSPILPP